MSTTGDDRWAGPLPAVDNNLWQLWITRQNRPDAGYRGHRHRRCAAIPGCPVTAVAASVGLYPLRRACVTMLGVTTVAGIAALCLSATANRQLLAGR